MNDKSDMDKEYHNKLKQLKLPEKCKDMQKEYIDTLYQYYIENKNLIINDVKPRKTKIVLKILNKILKIAKKEPIDNITDFRSLREDIVNKECQEYFESKFDEIFTLFNKKKHKFYMRTKINAYILSFLKSATKELGYNLSHKQETRKKKIDGKCMFYNSTEYFIT